jgi:hypothetical protein
MGLDVSGLNIFAIAVGGFVYMMYGGIYYSILLGKKKDAQNTGPFKYIFSVIVAFISSFLVAILVQATGSENAVAGLAIGFIIGLLISLVYVKNMLFGLMTSKSCTIAVGDHLIVFSLLGLLHGLMN